MKKGDEEGTTKGFLYVVTDSKHLASAEMSKQTWRQSQGGCHDPRLQIGSLGFIRDKLPIHTLGFVAKLTSSTD
jgi:hypothetical protein